MLDLPDGIEALPPRSPSLIRLLDDAREAGEAISIAVQDRELPITDDTSYGMLMTLVDRLETIEGIRQGLREAEAGLGRPVEEAFEELRQRYNIPRDV
jgi:hypothetical protein